MAYLAGAGRSGDAVWLAVGVVGAGYALWDTAAALLQRRLGVDVIVTLAVAGAAWAGFGAARAVVVLVVATPCPLILAAPVAWVSGLPIAARRGVVVKGGAVLVRLAQCTILLLDKTGRLTSGRAALAAMGVAAAGLLPPVWGALLQEGIDVAVILNALRALRPGISGPHQQAEERQLFPALDELPGGMDLTASMSRAHIEITRQIRQLGQLLDDIDAASPDQVDIADLRGLLYGLHATLRLHIAQEDESYLSLGGDAEHRAGQAVQDAGYGERGGDAPAVPP